MFKEADITGTGWAFPPRFNVETATTIMTSGVDDINESLRILFTTEIGERVMQPNYGSALKSMMFEQMDQHFKSYMRLVLTRSITLYEARIRPVSLEFLDDEMNEGRYLMSLDYIVVETRMKNNFLFPFYLNK